MGKKVLLIADDDEMNRVIIRRFLKNTFEIIEAEDGRKAMDLIRSTKIDALLLDIIMPEMDGLEVLECIKQEAVYGSMGILVATSTKEKTERTALSLGADDVVSKPYDPVVIQKRLENILAVKAVREQNKMMEDKDVEALIQNRLGEVAVKAEKSSEKLRKIAQIIEQNIENEKLVTEMVLGIQKEADAITNLFSDND